jgi:hypothetical protein
MDYVQLQRSVSCSDSWCLKLLREIKVSNFSDFCNSFQSLAAENWKECLCWLIWDHLQMHCYWLQHKWTVQRMTSSQNHVLSRRAVQQSPHLWLGMAGIQLFCLLVKVQWVTCCPALTLNLLHPIHIITVLLTSCLARKIQYRSLICTRVTLAPECIPFSWWYFISISQYLCLLGRTHRFCSLNVKLDCCGLPPTRSSWCSSWNGFSSLIFIVIVSSFSCLQ